MPEQPQVVKLHPEARSELKTSVEFYRKRGGERWAMRFKERVSEGLRAIAANPERYPPAPELPGVQKFRLEQFPFSLLYVRRTNYLWVVAIAHAKRRPSGHFA